MPQHRLIFFFRGRSLSENWTQALGFDVVEDWRPWTLDGRARVGGYVTSYDGDFAFLTIRGSGHMVPGSCAVVPFFRQSRTLATTTPCPHRLGVRPALLSLLSPSEYRPAAASVFINAWLKNETYPHYSP